MLLCVLLWMIYCSIHFLKLFLAKFRLFSLTMLKIIFLYLPTSPFALRPCDPAVRSPLFFEDLHYWVFCSFTLCIKVGISSLFYLIYLMFPSEFSSTLKIFSHYLFNIFLTFHSLCSSFLFLLKDY